MYKILVFLQFLFLLVFLPIFVVSQNSQANEPHGVQTIVIDAGHGGKDPGCVSKNKIYEKDIVLKVAKLLGGYIEKNFEDVKVIYTRDTDVFVELQKRAEIANKNKADLFISLHCNANPNTKASGSETYVMGLHKTESHLAVAQRENASILMEDNYEAHYEDFDPNSVESYIAMSLQANAFLDQSLDLASAIQKQFKERVQRKDRGVKQAGFWVLYRTTMPSVLIELGFLSNAEEEKFLKSENGQVYMASAIYRAFKNYKLKYDASIKNVQGQNNKKEQETKIENMAPKSADEIKPETLPNKEKNEVKEGKINKEPEKVEQKEITKTDNESETENEKIDKIEKPNPSELTKNNNNKKDSTNAVVFKIQVATSQIRIDTKSAYFRGIVVEEYKENKMYKYTAGNFSNFNQAVDMQNSVRKMGFKDAFVVAFKNGERISLQDALNNKK